MEENVSFSAEELQTEISRKFLTKPIREKILKLLLAGERPCNISRNHNLNPNWVYRVNIERRGYKMKNGRFIKKVKEGIFDVNSRTNWLVSE